MICLNSIDPRWSYVLLDKENSNESTEKDLSQTWPPPVFITRHRTICWAANRYSKEYRHKKYFTFQVFLMRQYC